MGPSVVRLMLVVSGGRGASLPGRCRDAAAGRFALFLRRTARRRRGIGGSPLRNPRTRGPRRPPPDA
ncbi:hypothetical protein FRAAL0802 [Frankia alni ACN14a]|uniref:Uncharacterized protein n=1 Tax=Frankia alni (strain DSM 45986 / CECT 9034 / ACN14a) TaxID=326424 RepID=Q0RSJ1_FRAAA|nr:hypothetical protein FRAAL0802 [Frankia alni ACN14a]